MLLFVRGRILYRCLKRFGLFKGVSLWLRLMLQRGEVKLALPGYAHEIYLRKGTSDLYVFEKVLACEEYKPTKMNPKLIVDLGANVGYSSLYFANAFPESKVLAIEPEAQNFAQLVKNTRSYANVERLHCAVWPVAEALTIANPQADHWEFQVWPAQNCQSATVAVVTLPDLLAQNEDGPIDILKIDIESAEKYLFSVGTQTWLSKVRLIIIELHDNLLPGCSQAFYRAISQYEFNQFIVGENTFVIFATANL